jgi:hypothetical protein
MAKQRGKKTGSIVKKSVKHSRKRATKTSIKQAAKKTREKPRKVTGTVLRIVHGKPTDQRLSAEDAFNDPSQAAEQVLYAERHGSKEELKLVRLAYRQYQKKRFRSK